MYLTENLYPQGTLQETSCAVTNDCFNEIPKNEMIGTLFFPFLVALLFTVVLTPPLMKAASKVGLLDVPNDERGERTVHKVATPRVGGLAIIASIVFTIILWLPINQEIVGLLLGVGVILLFGVWDDRVNLDFKIKFLGQFLAAYCVAGPGGVLVQHMPFFDGFTVPYYLALPLTVLILVAITNAINLSDGLDGLSGGKTLLIFGCLAVLGFRCGDIQFTLISVIFMGAILGFLRFNTHPARVFLGDTGSQVLGLNAAALAIILTQQSNPALSPVLPLLLFVLPIFDTVSVMVQRLYLGRSPFSPDKNHFHHKLLVLGFNHHEAVMVVYLLQSVLVLGVYFLRYETDGLLLALFFLVCFCLSGVLYLTLQRGWRVTEAMDRPSFRWGRAVWLVRLSQGISTITVPLLLVVAVLLPYKISSDFMVVALVVLVATLMVMGFKPPFQSTVERVCVYIASAFAVYFYGNSGYQEEDFKWLLNSAFFILVLAVLVGARFSNSNRFSITTLDYLVVFLCLVVPIVSIFTEHSAPLAEISAKLVVLMYASEVAMSAGTFQFRGLVVCSACALAVVCSRWFLQSYFF